MLTRPHGSNQTHYAARAMPHVVEIEVPPRGLRKRLDALHVWALERCSLNGFAALPNFRMDTARKVELVVFHFLRRADADASFEHIAGPETHRSNRR